MKYGGLSAGGTERWLQMMAAHLPRDRFQVDYYFSDTVPFKGSSSKAPGTDPARVKYMLDHDVNLIEFHISARDPGSARYEWIESDFFDLFEPSAYDLVQTGKGGSAEYPFHILPNRVVELVTLSGGVDRSPNVVFSVHLSEWQRRQWDAAGGAIERSAVIPIPAFEPASTTELRSRLNIPRDALVIGFHQRPDNNIFSSIPLDAFAQLRRGEVTFVLFGGGSDYRRQATELGLENIYFLEPSGDAETISAFLNTLDVFTHGRKDGETFGAVIAEAMMHGKPCLSHRSAENNAQVETIGPGGFIAHNVGEYSAHLARLLDDEDLRLRLGQRAQDHARSYYSLRPCVDELARLYEHLNRGSPEAFIPSRTPYAEVDLGFLMAGDKHRQGLERHIGENEPLRGLRIHAWRFLLPTVKTVVDLGAGDGLYTLLAARDCRKDAEIHAFESDDHALGLLRMSLGLNAWDERVATHAIGQSIEAEQMMQRALKDAGLVRIDLRSVPEENEQSLIAAAIENVPALFIQLHAEDSVPALARLINGKGYDLFLVGKNRVAAARFHRPQPYPPTYLALHRSAHYGWLKQIQASAHAYRRDSRRQALLTTRAIVRRAGRAVLHPAETVAILRDAWDRGVRLKSVISGVGSRDSTG